MPFATAPTKITMTRPDFTQLFTLQSLAAYSKSRSSRPKPVSSNLLTVIDNIKQITNQSWLLEAPSTTTTTTTPDPVNNNVNIYSATSPIGSHLNKRSGSGGYNYYSCLLQKNDSYFSLFDTPIHPVTTSHISPKHISDSDNDSDVSYIRLDDVNDSEYDGGSESDGDSGDNEDDDGLMSESDVSFSASDFESDSEEKNGGSGNGNGSRRHAELQEMMYQWVKLHWILAELQYEKEVVKYDADESEGGVSLSATWP